MRSLAAVRRLRFDSRYLYASFLLTTFRTSSCFEPSPILGNPLKLFSIFFLWICVQIFFFFFYFRCYTVHVVKSLNNISVVVSKIIVFTDFWRECTKCTEHIQKVIGVAVAKWEWVRTERIGSSIEGTWWPVSFITHTERQLQFTTVLTTGEVAEVRCCYWWFLKAYGHISPGSAGVGARQRGSLLVECKSTRQIAAA